MIQVDCKDVLSIRDELLVYVSDNLAAIPTLKNNQFTLSKLDDEPISISEVIPLIKEFLDSIGEGRNFAVITENDRISIQSISGKTIYRDPTPTPEIISCTHCGFVTRYKVEMDVHMRIHYI